ncbi:MAG: FAD-dependent oxidoreductase [Alphaproteobacteria bacterium]|nr:FAD-dependent oxidoreductase [Alphaproteobacteria bacterium]
MAKKPDLIIVGAGGIHGSAAAARLSKEFNVVGFEQFERGTDKGSSGGWERMSRLATGEGMNYAVGARFSQEKILDLQAATGRELLRITGGIDSSPPSRDPVNDPSWVQTVKGIRRELGLPFEETNGHDLKKRKENFNLNLPDDTEIVIESDMGIISTAAREVNLSIAEANGAQFYFNTRVAGLDYEHRTAVIMEDGQRIDASKIVCIGGNWLNDLLDEKNKLPIINEQRFLAYYPILENHGAVPYVYYTKEHIIYGMPSWKGGLFKTGDSNHLREVISPGAGLTPPGDADYAVTDRIPRELMTGIGGQAVDFMKGRYSITPRGDFIIDLHPDNPDIVLESACSGHGFKHFPFVAEIVHELATGEPSGFELSRFRIRSNDRAALQQQISLIQGKKKDRLPLRL